jgi:hypothetical protein
MNHFEASVCFADVDNLDRSHSSPPLRKIAPTPLVNATVLHPRFGVEARARL